MYDFYYDQILPHFNDNVYLNYSDTDSFIMTFINNRPYEFIRENIHLFDTSDYPLNNV